MFEDRTIDARVRRKAKRLGWRVEKSRVRLTHFGDQGLYQLIDDRNYVVCGASYDASLAELECWLEDQLKSTVR